MENELIPTVQELNSIRSEFVNLMESELYKIKPLLLNALKITQKTAPAYMYISDEFKERNYIAHKHNINLLMLQIDKLESDLHLIKNDQSYFLLLKDGLILTIFGLMLLFSENGLRDLEHLEKEGILTI